ncbi:MAG: TRAFs-binding domain-containing protein [Sulfurimonas sp.]|nr:TRAFs-binding domain-containing protein [Sulfurimonas sp.]MDD3060903.1 TRAFs-binding domain-containing protein [Sulfurimonas sp.]MDD5201846.1 TRAFs-binding domain-containing protein [Sulfurimonas sp.]
MNPLCFVLMPFGSKKDENGQLIDFDKIYSDFIKPSIEDAGLEPIRADEEQIGGIIHKPMYERLMLCEYAVADLSTANANVFYELGIRHAIRPHSTISIFSSDTKLPFDINFLRSLPYDRELSDLESLKKQLTEKLLHAKKEKHTDSPLFQLVDGLAPSNIEHIKTDVFRERVEYNKTIKSQLKSAREIKPKEDAKVVLKNLHSSLGTLSEIEAGVIIDLFLSYRAVEAYSEMVELVSLMSKPLQQTVMVQEQLGFALNRVGRRKEAIEVLEEVINKHGKNSETCGILGRVYKDYWQVNSSNETLAKGYLKKAIQTYLDGFESDFRDAYPGINAVTLMDISGDKRKDEILPVVTYAVKQKMKSSADYWDYATLLELAILENNQEKAQELISDVLVHVKEDWEKKTTANNIKFIREHRESKGLECAWLTEIEKKLNL